MVAAMQICGHGGKLSVHGGVRNAAHEGRAARVYCVTVRSLWLLVGSWCGRRWVILARLLGLPAFRARSAGFH